MGIFGAGNAGSSLTKFIAPLIIAASATASWRAVPQVYAVAMLVMAVLFWFLTSEDPLHRKDAAARRHALAGRAAEAAARPPRLALRPRVLLRVRRLRRDGAVAAQVLRRRVRPAAGHRRVPDHPVRPALRGDPRAGRLGVRQVGRQHRHLVGDVGQPRLHVPAELSAHDDDRPRDQGRRRGRHRRGRDDVHRADLHRRPGAGLRQGQRLPQPGRPLPDPDGRGRRHRRRHRRPGRVHAADHVRHRRRRDRGAQQLLHADDPRDRRHHDLDVGRGAQRARRASWRSTPRLRAALAGAELDRARRPRRHVLVDWRPDDEAFWATTGRRIANRNLLAVDAPAAAGLRGLGGVERGRRRAAAHRLQVHAPTSCSGWPRCRGSPARSSARCIRSSCRSSAGAT